MLNLILFLLLSIRKSLLIAIVIIMNSYNRSGPFSEGHFEIRIEKILQNKGYFIKDPLFLLSMTTQLLLLRGGGV